ncbi:large ribosomal subunit protein mL48 isoform X3 [Tenrec ecaudatus]|uniref:large ribosomal subunit protein mL48 isoform X3 n=1 Tax=Tenrec ecaudatus TaxID=94439 RepID=UPI003F59E793
MCENNPPVKAQKGSFYPKTKFRVLGKHGQWKQEASRGSEVLCLRNDPVFKQAISLFRCRTFGENPICSMGGFLLSTRRHYKSRPTHGIGRYKHLIQAQETRKKGKVEVRPINVGTDYEYGVVNVHLIAYDMALAESCAQHVHNLCNHYSIKVEESYAMPTKSTEVLRLQDQGNKMFLDSVLTTHERVVQWVECYICRDFLGDHPKQSS